MTAFSCGALKAGTAKGALRTLKRGQTLQDASAFVEDGDRMHGIDELYRRLFESAGDAILVHDRAGIILLANPQAGALLGYPPDRLKGIRVSDLCPSEERETLGYAAQLLSAKGIVRFEVRFQKDNGKIVHTEVSASLVDREKGVVQAAFRDIGERIRSEKRLQDYSSTLESRVAARTRDLEAARKELSRKQKLALLGQLSAGVAHELRNPLGAVKAAAYFLNMVLKEPSSEVKESLEILAREVTVSERIIRRLFDYADPRAPRPRIMDFCEVINDLALAAKAMGLTVGIDVPGEGPLYVCADWEHLSKAFMHIMQNSRQAMPKGGNIGIRCEGDPDWVVVTWTDSGEGIPAENLPKAFEPFYTTRAKGIGLGLPLARTFVEMHGGRIVLDSREGEGTTVIVFLPRAETHGASGDPLKPEWKGPP